MAKARDREKFADALEQREDERLDKGHGALWYAPRAEARLPREKLERPEDCQSKQPKARRAVEQHEESPCRRAARAQISARVGDTLLVSYSIGDEFAPEFTETYDIALGGMAMLTNAELNREDPINVQIELRSDPATRVARARRRPLVALRSAAAALSHRHRLPRRR